MVNILVDGVEREATEDDLAAMMIVDHSQVPQQVTMRQARLALLAIGKLDDVDGAIDALDSPDKEAARIEWEYARDVERNSPIVTMMGAALNLTEDELDRLFIDAATL